MTEGMITMSRKEVDRLSMVEQLAAGGMKQAPAAERLGISVRQVRRWLRGYRGEGAAGLVSRRRGRPSVRALPAALRAEVLALVGERHTDFSLALMHEKLTEVQGYRFSVETLRQTFIPPSVQPVFLVSIEVTPERPGTHAQQLRRLFLR